MDLRQRYKKFVDARREEARRVFRTNPYLVALVDMDKTLTLDTCWTEEECQNAAPNQTMIDIINSLHVSDTVIVYTARHDRLIPATLKWLRKHDVKFAGISNNKVPASIYLDDKGFNPLEGDSDEKGCDSCLGSGDFRASLRRLEHGVLE